MRLGIERVDQLSLSSFYANPLLMGFEQGPLLLYLED